MKDLTETFSPAFAPHVAGRYTKREQDPATGQPLDQIWQAECTKCGASFGPAPCSSGMVNQRIAWFAQDHTHRDHLNDPFPKSTP